MWTEWCLLAALFISTLLLAGRQWRSVSFLAVFCGAALLLIGMGFTWQRHLQRSESSNRELREKVPHPEKNEYVSSANCRACHPDQYASWHRSFHRTMTQLAAPETVRGDFKNVVLKFDGDDYRLERRGKEFWVEMVDPDWKLVRALQQQAYETGKAKAPPREPVQRPRIWKRIDMLTGSHNMQAYWVAGEFGNQQFSFPFTFIFEDQRWAPRDEVFLKDPEAPKLVQVWNGSCIRCHATAGKPLQDPKTSIFKTEVAELGIACEACHGPAYQHVKSNQQPLRRYAQHARGHADPTIVNPARLDSRRSTEVCGNCHGVKFIRDQEDWMAHGFRFRPGGKLEDDAPVVIRLAKVPADPRFPEEVRKQPEVLHGTFWPDGMIRVSGREYNGLLETPCYQRGEMSCLSCHSMHKSDPDDQLAAQMEGNQACYQCHGKYRQTLAQHTHHPEKSSGSLCYNCHMPHTTYGLLKAIRSHQVSNPSVPTTLQTGRPNACNLCHLDKSLGWTATQLTQWYGAPKPNLTEDDQNTSAAVLSALRGDANQRALAAWHMGWTPALETSGRDWVTPYLSQLLTDRYSAVRYVAYHSLKRQPAFVNLKYDYLGTAEERRAVQEKALQLAFARPLANTKSSVLINSDGRWQTNKVTKLWLQRDERPMDLLE